MTKLAILLSLLAATAAAQPQIAIGEYVLPSSQAQPTVITAGPDGALWFTEQTANKIGRISVAGAVTEYPIPTRDSQPVGITAGPDGALWFTESDKKANNIGRITTNGQITEYPLSDAPFSVPTWITAGPDGALWFTQSGKNLIGRITAAGVITKYPVANPITVNLGLYGITAGPDGALWFTEITANRIGRITTAGAITQYAIPTANSNSFVITAGPDGALWFTEANVNRIGRITTAGVFTEYPLATANSVPAAIVAGPDAALWFTEYSANKIGRITTAGVITEYPVPTAGSLPDVITLADGELWFAAADKIGEVIFETAGLSVTPATGIFRQNLTFAGSGYAPTESVRVYVKGVGSATLASATADSTGAFTVTARSPQSPFGPRLFLGLGQASGKLGAASFSETPRLIIVPGSGAAGSTAVAQGYGFGSFESVRVYWNNIQTFLGTATANINGTFSGSAALSFTVPASPPGANVVKGIGQTTQAVGQGSFTVQ